MRRVSFIVLAVILAGCASTIPPPPSSLPSDPWNTVTAIERGTEVVVHGRCPEDETDSCPPDDAVATAAGYRLEGSLAEASAASILVAPRSRDAQPIPVSRASVTRVFIEESNSNLKGILLGTVTGLAVCAVAGVYHEPDHGSLLLSGTAMLTYACAGGGATIGYFADRDPPTLVLVYER